MFLPLGKQVGHHLSRRTREPGSRPFSRQLRAGAPRSWGRGHPKASESGDPSPLPPGGTGLLHGNLTFFQPHLPSPAPPNSPRQGPKTLSLPPSTPRLSLSTPPGRHFGPTDSDHQPGTPGVSGTVSRLWITRRASPWALTH